MFRLLCRVGLHTWVDVRTVCTRCYEVCLYCNARRVRQVMPYDDHPIEIDWLDGGKWTPPATEGGTPDADR